SRRNLQRLTSSIDRGFVAAAIKEDPRLDLLRNRIERIERYGAVGGRQGFGLPARLAQDQRIVEQRQNVRSRKRSRTFEIRKRPLQLKLILVNSSKGSIADRQLRSDRNRPPRRFNRL